MAIEYNLTVSPVMSDTETLEYLAGLLNLDRRYSDHRAGRDDLIVTVGTDTAAEDPEMAAWLGGAKAMVSATFRQVHNIGDEHDAIAFRDMLTAASRLFEDFPDAKGTFSFQGEIIYLQRLGDEGIVLDQRLREADTNRYGVLDDLLDRYPVRPVEQIFL